MNFQSRVFFLIGISLLFFGSYLVWQRYSPKKLEFNNLEVNPTISSEISPVRIIIPKLKIDNNIFASTITNNKWQASTEGISYLTSSPIPGSQGNSILYGHNWKSLLGNLIQIKPGEKIIVVMNNGETREFQVQFTSIVDPSQAHILAQTSDKRITLYTCTGFLDTKRFVTTATLVN